MTRQPNPTNIARETLKIKDTFPNLQNKKIEIVQKIISSQDKPKLRISMTTKGLSCKQVILPMKGDNANNFIKDLSMHVININWILKNIKSNIMADYIHVDGKGIIMITNNIASPSELQAIEKYIKSVSCVDIDQVQSPWLPQSKLYLKIVSILYLSEVTNSQITSEDIERVLKNTHIFNNVVLASKSRIIKVLLKSNMAIIWINIWDAQSDSKAKSLINQRFNIERFIATIQGTNMNPGVPSTKIAGSGATLLAFVEYKGQSVSNAMAYTKPSTIENFHGVAKPMTKSTCLDLKWRMVSPVPTPSDAPTARASIKLTLLTAHSGNTILTKSSTARNMLNFAKTTRNQFIHLWMTAKYDS